jgi:hypothetical protein
MHSVGGAVVVLSFQHLCQRVVTLPQVDAQDHWFGTAQAASLPANAVV